LFSVNMFVYIGMDSNNVLSEILIDVPIQSYMYLNKLHVICTIKHQKSYLTQ